MTLPISMRELTADERRGAQLVTDFLDNRFLLYQDDPMHFKLSIFRNDWVKFIKKNGLHFKGGW